MWNYWYGVNTLVDTHTHTGANWWHFLCWIRPCIVVVYMFYSLWVNRSGQVRSGQVWEHAPEQRVAASTFHQYSRGLRQGEYQQFNCT